MAAAPWWHAAIFEGSATAVLVVAADGRPIAANDAARRLLGCALEELPALADLLAVPDAAVPWPPVVRRVRERDLHVHRRGETAPDGAVVLVVELFDLTPFTRRERELLDRVGRDDLTGLASRAGFLEAAARLVGERRRRYRPLAVGMIDLDGFKAVNDRAGHAVGDAVLAGAARLCRRCLRGEDVIGRLGGDEFALLLPGTVLSAALQVGARLCARVHAARGGAELAGQLVSVSVGLAMWRSAEDGIDQALARADRALYAAKAAGGGLVRSHDD